MSRLLAYAGRPVGLADLVFGGSHSFFGQAVQPHELLHGSLAADGYGVAWYAGERPARIAEARPIWYEPSLADTLAAIEAPVVLAALGVTTPGVGMDRGRLLPCVHQRWTFALDGFVPDFQASHMRALRRELPDELYAELRGASAAETLFLLALSRMVDGATMVEGLTHAARAVHARVGRTEAQLNMVMSDGRAVAAIRSGTVLVTNSLYLAEHPPFAPGGVVLASEAPESGAVWGAVDGHSWVEIGIDGTVRTDLLFLD